VADTHFEKEGIVKWFNNSKGFGFIEIEGEADAMVHHSDIVMEGFRTLRDGQKVAFEVEQTDKGARAVKVRPLPDV
jgi:CspA family cold shock protein